MQKQETQKLRSKILATLSIAFAILLVSIVYLLQIQQKESLKNYKQTTDEYIQKSVNYTLQNTIHRYKTITTRMIEHFDIKSFVNNNDKEGLYAILKPRFDDLQEENTHFQTMHFVKADGSSFLRVHQKEKSGDNIAKLRPMLQEILKNKQPLIGYETGLYATVFRILVPVFDGEKFLGSFGIGIHANFFMEHISRMVEHKGALFIQQQDLQIFEKHSKYDIQIDGFMLQTDLDKKFLTLLKELPKNYNFEDHQTLTHNNKNYLLHIKDVDDFQNTTKGKFLFVEDITEEIKQIQHTQYFVLALTLVLFLIIYATLRFYFVKFDTKLNNTYETIIDNLESNKNYLKAIEDNSASIIITTFNDKIYSANKLFFEFTRYDSLEAFSKDYTCICDLFIPKYGYLQREIDGLYWIDYILQNPKKSHKAIMIQNNQEHIFKVTTTKVNINGNTHFISSFVDITDIEEIKNRLSYAINGSKDGLWDWNLQTNEIYFSPRWKEMLGFGADEIPDDLQEWNKRVHPDDLEQALADIKANQEGKTDTFANKHRLKHKDGHWVWIQDRGQTIFDDNGKPLRMVGFHTDITEQMKEREYLNIQARRAEALLDLPKLAEKLDEKEFMQKGQEIAEDLTNSNIAFIHFVNDDEQTIELVTWSNRTLQHYCKMDVKESHYPVNQAGVWADSLRKRKPVVVNDYPNYTKKLGMPEGHAHLERFVSVPVIENGKVVMITGVGNKKEDYSSLDVETVQLVSNDIWQTVQRKRNSTEMQKKDKVMLAQSRNAAMGEMISMIAHQWRQPLAIISMGANNILADIELEMLDEKELVIACEEIIEQTKELSTTIDDFKNFFKPQKIFTKVYLDEVVEKTLKVVGKSLENNNVAIKTNTTTSRQIETFSRELMQVFINIINNAKEVLVEREIENKLIKIDAIEQEETLKISIEDNGGGILLDDIHKVFEPYFSTKDEKTGTGLGLYMSKTIVEKHLLGTIDVHNSNLGAVFEIKIPYKIEKRKENNE